MTILAEGTCNNTGYYDGPLISSPVAVGPQSICWGEADFYYVSPYYIDPYTFGGPSIEQYITMELNATGWLGVARVKLTGISSSNGQWINGGSGTNSTGNSSALALPTPFTIRVEFDLTTGFITALLNGVAVGASYAWQGAPLPANRNVSTHLYAASANTYCSLVLTKLTLGVTSLAPTLFWTNKVLCSEQ